MIIPNKRPKPVIHQVNLKGFLKQRKIIFELLKKRETKYAMEAAQASGIPLKNIVKTLVFVNEQGQPFVAILRADRYINRHAL